MLAEAGVTKIVAVGDQITEGWLGDAKYNPDLSYPAKLQKILNNKN